MVLISCVHVQCNISGHRSGGAKIPLLWIKVNFCCSGSVITFNKLAKTILLCGMGQETGSNEINNSDENKQAQLHAFTSFFLTTQGATTTNSPIHATAQTINWIMWTAYMYSN